MCVFSTYVEVILGGIVGKWGGDGILHVCGGDPILVNMDLKRLVYSPRMWR